MAEQDKPNELTNLPPSVVRFIGLVIKKMRYSARVRREVRAELQCHFADALAGCETEQQREQKARSLVSDFGDLKLLAILMRRAKKRCRPAWKKAIVRTVQAAAVLVVAFVIYTAWFVAGRPVATIDYLALWNQQSRPEVLDRDNAWPDYQKAVHALAPLSQTPRDTRLIDANRSMRNFDFDNLTTVDRDEIRNWVQQNEEAWRSFEVGASKPYCHWTYSLDPNDEDPWLMSVCMPPLAELRTMAKLGIWRSRIELSEENTQQATQDCLAVARAAQHFQGKGHLVQQRVGAAISSLAHLEILHIVETQKLSAADLVSLREQLSQLYPEGYPLMDFEGERLLFLDTVQHVFTNGGPGGGHLTPRGLLDVTDNQNASMPPITEVYAVPASMLHAGRDETVAKGNELYDLMLRSAGITPWQRRAGDANDPEHILMSLSSRRFFLLKTLLPAVFRVSEIAYRAKLTHEATLTILALRQWWLEKSQYPASLNELVVAGYLKELPMDPFSDKPLTYRRIDDGFTLYSVGPDFTDDGGTPGRDRKGWPNNWAQTGDAVFWPIPKPPKPSPSPS
jgi:hypothetical protein